MGAMDVTLGPVVRILRMVGVAATKPGGRAGREMRLIYPSSNRIRLYERADEGSS